MCLARDGDSTCCANAVCGNAIFRERLPVAYLSERRARAKDREGQLQCMVQYEYAPAVAPISPFMVVNDVRAYGLLCAMFMVPIATRVY